MRYASITSRLAELGSGKWTLHTRARQLKASGAELIELTIGEPDLPPDRALLEECQRAMNADATAIQTAAGSRRSSRRLPKSTVAAVPP